MPITQFFNEKNCPFNINCGRWTHTIGRFSSVCHLQWYGERNWTATLPATNIIFGKVSGNDNSNNNNKKQALPRQTRQVKWDSVYGCREALLCRPSLTAIRTATRKRTFFDNHLLTGNSLRSDFFHFPTRPRWTRKKNIRNHHSNSSYPVAWGAFALNKQLFHSFAFIITIMVCK